MRGSNAASAAVAPCRANGSLGTVRRILAAAALLLIAASCGDGGPAPSASAPGDASGATPTSTPDPFGPPPQLGEYVLEVSPPHRARVRQEELVAESPLTPGGICARVDFRDLAENALWFRMAVDAEEVTPRLSWFGRAGSTEATVCYAPPDALAPGIHQVALVVQNPFNQNEPPRQIVMWGFEVTP